MLFPSWTYRISHRHLYKLLRVFSAWNFVSPNLTERVDATPIIKTSKVFMLASTSVVFLNPVPCLLAPVRTITVTFESNEYFKGYQKNKCNILIMIAPVVKCGGSHHSWGFCTRKIRRRCCVLFLWRLLSLECCFQ